MIHLAVTRLRQLALSAAVGNFQLALSEDETISGGAIVTRYREIGDAGDAKMLTCRLKSSGEIAYSD